MCKTKLSLPAKAQPGCQWLCHLMNNAFHMVQAHKGYNMTNCFLSQKSDPDERMWK